MIGNGDLDDVKYNPSVAGVATTHRSRRDLTVDSASLHELAKTLRATGDDPVQLPVAIEWLRAAVKLPGQSPVAIALELVELSSRCGRQENLLLTPRSVARTGLTRVSAFRALRTLEAAGLASVRRHKGRSPLVAIKLPSTDGEESPV